MVYRDVLHADVDYARREDYLANAQDEARQDFRQRNAVSRLDLVGRVGVRSGKWLDIGTNEGMTLWEAGKRGFAAIGCEPNIQAADFARKLGLCVVAGDLDSVFEELKKQGPFDVVSLFHVLEHIQDPGAMLQRLKGLLSQQGVLVLEVPDFSSPLSRVYGWQEPRVAKEHLSFFSNKTLGLLLASRGYQVMMARRRNDDEFRRSFFDNVIRLPGFTFIYAGLRAGKHFFRHARGHKEAVPVSGAEGLWPRGPMKDEHYFLERFMGRLVEFFNRGDNLFVVARVRYGS